MIPIETRSLIRLARFSMLFFSSLYAICGRLSSQVIGIGLESYWILAIFAIFYNRLMFRTKRILFSMRPQLPIVFRNFYLWPSSRSALDER